MEKCANRSKTITRGPPGARCPDATNGSTPAVTAEQVVASRVWAPNRSFSSSSSRAWMLGRIRVVEVPSSIVPISRTASTAPSSTLGCRLRPR